MGRSPRDHRRRRAAVGLRIGRQCGRVCRRAEGDWRDQRRRRVVGGVGVERARLDPFFRGGCRLRRDRAGGLADPQPAHPSGHLPLGGAGRAAARLFRSAPIVGRAHPRADLRLSHSRLRAEHHEPVLPRSRLQPGRDRRGPQDFRHRDDAGWRVLPAAWRWRGTVTCARW